MNARAESPLAAAERAAEAGRLQESNAILRPLLRQARSRHAALRLLARNYERMGKMPACQFVLRELTELEPLNRETWFWLGNVLAAATSHANAVKAFDRVLRLRPAPEAAFNMANSLMALGRPGAAAEAFETALRMRPEWSACLTNLSNAQLELGQHEEARRSLEAAHRLHEQDPQIRRNLANLLLFDGLSERALTLYESRFRVEPFASMPTHGLPVLGSRSAEGMRILVQWEQAFGDVIQMLRFVPLLETSAGACAWQLLKPLHELARRACPEIRILEPGAHTSEGFDARLPYTSLPLALRLFDDASVPAQPYLRPDPEKVRAWKEWLPRGAPPIGLVWRGREHPRFRSVPLAQLLPLLQTGLSFLALQKDITEDERRLLSLFPNVTDASERIANFDDTAAAIASTRLVISIDTAVAHLVGALGHPCWVMLKKAADWRWKAEGSTTVWYPSLRLFRQRTFPDWSTVVAEVCGELQRL